MSASGRLNIISVASDPTVFELRGVSGQVANASAVATLTGAVNKLSWITGFEVTASGSTAGLVVEVTIVGTVMTLSYTFVFPAGALVSATPLIVEFPRPLPASAFNTPIVVTVPAGGVGNTNASVVAHGYRV